MDKDDFSPEVIDLESEFDINPFRGKGGLLE
jgi:hypothetical protein